MEYFLGSLITLIIMAYFSNKANKVVNVKQNSARLSQAYVHNLVFDKLIDEIAPEERPLTQSSDWEKKNEVRVIVLDNEAYWIVGQTLYVAQVVNGDVDNDSTKKVDTMNMDAVQLEKTQFIVQKLTEGKGNDSGYPRKSQF
jgi:hypothetical protein